MTFRILIPTIILLYMSQIGFAQSQSDRYMSDRYRKIYYTSIEDAERKLKQYHHERESKEISDIEDHSTNYFPFDMFKSLVKFDERTLKYRFSLNEIAEISSPDETVKLYSWVYGDYSTTGKESDGILTYKTKDRYRYEESTKGYDGYHNLVVPSDTDKIEMLCLDDGLSIFLFFASHRTMTSYTDWVTAYIISNNSFEPYHIFNIEGELSSSIRRGTGSGGDYIGGIEFENGKLLISQEGYLSDFWKGYTYPTASGYKDVYKFNGQRFVYENTIYDEDIPLNCTLRNFKANVACIDFLPWKVRIDQMPNGSFRYASWKNKDMSENPDLVINNGSFTSTKIDKGWQGEIVDFVFTNNGYEYVVTYELVEYNRFKEFTPISLKVKHSGKILMTVKHK